MMLIENPQTPLQKPATAGQAIMGSLPFLVFGLFMILLELPFDRGMPPWMAAVGGFLLICLLVLPAIGFGIGWVSSFPRWSYAYVALALIMALYFQHSSTPGLSIFGYPIFGRALWGWRSWMPLMAALFVALAVSRSFRPLARVFTNVREDWSILSYLLVGLLPLLILIEFDEMDRLFSLYFMVPFAVLLVATVVSYLLARHTWQRVLALSLGTIATIVPAAVGPTSYWLERGGMSVDHARGVPLRAVAVILIVLLPAWLELLRRSVKDWQGTRKP